jgi:hypothetical protein
LLGAAIANFARRGMYFRVAAVPEVAIAGCLIAIGSCLLSTGCTLVAVRLRLVSSSEPSDRPPACRKPMRWLVLGGVS